MFWSITQPGMLQDVVNTEPEMRCNVMELKCRQVIAAQQGLCYLQRVDCNEIGDLITVALEFRRKKSKVKSDVMTNNHSAFENFKQRRSDPIKRGGVENIARRHSVDMCRPDVSPRVYESLKTGDNVERRVHADRTEFDNSISSARREACGFKIDNSESARHSFPINFDNQKLALPMSNPS